MQENSSNISFTECGSDEERDCGGWNVVLTGSEGGCGEAPGRRAEGNTPYGRPGSHRVAQRIHHLGAGVAVSVASN